MTSAGDKGGGANPSAPAAAGEAHLLPAGLQDVLPPQAAHEAATIERLLACLAGHGYERVKPPLIEFEETLLAGAGAALAPQTFRLMDPVSQRMMGLRADMTTQVARIAASRLSRQARPLRLCYAGQVLRVKGSQLRPERQFAQVGAELIGPLADSADAEVVLTASEALDSLGVQELSVDLTLPPLVGAIARGLGIDPATGDDLRAALDRKDAAAVAEVAGPHADLFEAVLEAAGPVGAALERLQALSLPEEAAQGLAQLARVISLIRARRPDLTMTLDPSEHRGFEYQTGVSFTLFARNVRGELGRGGRYDTAANGGQGEPATGFTLYMDSVLRALPQPAPQQRVFVPADAQTERAAALRAEGWATVQGLEPVTDAQAEGRRLGCSHALVDGELVAL
ncbi:MAG: ATP phosphoribosyltransferase regulatory subunit [Rhodovibrionaceae bacterium]|nr:ATP phosphoribosyltransferase regulatory subunit [Rhodovibrionaceae bacterium]